MDILETARTLPHSRMLIVQRLPLRGSVAAVAASVACSPSIPDRPSCATNESSPAS